jgi:hypothetical protein
MQLLAPVPNIRSSWCQDSPCPSNNIYSTAPLRLRRIDCLTAVSPWSESMNKNHFRWKIRFYEFLVFCQWPKLATVYSWVGTVNSHCSSWVLELVIGLCFNLYLCRPSCCSQPESVFLWCIEYILEFLQANKSCVTSRYLSNGMFCLWLQSQITMTTVFTWNCHQVCEWWELRDLTLPAAFEFAPFASGCHWFINLKLNAMHIWNESLLQPKLELSTFTWPMFLKPLRLSTVPVIFKS